MLSTVKTVVGSLQDLVRRVTSILDHHPTLKEFIDKIAKDNIGFLAAGLAWSILTSMIAFVAAVVAISGLILQDPAKRDAVAAQLSSSMTGVLSRQDVEAAVSGAQQHSALLALIAFVGIVWGGSSIGGCVATVFQPLFQVRGRPFIKEKLIDVGMVLVFATLLIVIASSSSAVARLNALVTQLPLPEAADLVLGIGIGLLGAFVLFFAVYTVFPNTDPKFKLPNVWKGAAIAAVMFEVLSLIFPIYVAISHFSKYGSLVAAILVLTAWIYFLALILLVGAEFVAFGAIRKARSQGVPAGPAPDGTVPQRMDLATKDSGHVVSP